MTFWLIWKPLAVGGKRRPDATRAVAVLQSVDTQFVGRREIRQGEAAPRRFREIERDVDIAEWQREGAGPQIDARPVGCRKSGGQAAVIGVSCRTKPRIERVRAQRGIIREQDRIGINRRREIIRWVATILGQLERRFGEGEQRVGGRLPGRGGLVQGAQRGPRVVCIKLRQIVASQHDFGAVTEFACRNDVRGQLPIYLSRIGTMDLDR